jgi:tetratricopeptide (TPR) repeat protein
MAKSNRNKGTEEEIIETVPTSNGGISSLIDNNQTTVIAGAGILLLLIGGFFAFKMLYQAPREKTAMEQVFKAEYQFQRDSFALALEAPGGGFEGFLDIIDNYGGTKAANLSKYYAGISYLNLGRYDDAVSFLESHNEKGNVTSITKYGALGDAYSELGNFSKAISSYERAVSNDNSLLTPYYLYKLGLLSVNQNQKDKALKAFTRISADYPNSIEAAEASKYIGLLN